MGNVHAHRGQLASAFVFTILVAVALLAFGAMLFTDNANAQASFTTCATCHPMAATHANANHASFFGTCTTCHNDGGTAKPPLPSACSACHGGVTNILKSTQHVANGCGTTAGCHGVAPAVVTTTMTAKVAPTSVTVGKKVKVSGIAGPVPALASAKVALKVERKVGTKWVKMKTGTATASATGAYAWSYKTAKKGAHRVTVSIAKSAKFTAKKLVKTFKVK
jgi:hypothetical protein